MYNKLLLRSVQNNDGFLYVRMEVFLSSNFRPRTNQPPTKAKAGVVRLIQGFHGLVHGLVHGVVQGLASTDMLGCWRAGHRFCKKKLIITYTSLKVSLPITQKS